MRMKNGVNKLALAIAGGSLMAFGLGGCAQMQTQPDAGMQSGQASAAEPEHHCNTAAATVIGGLLGAIAGKGKGHLVGAAVGAGVGALICTAYNYHVRKLRDAQQVNAAYEQQHGALPASNTISSYASSLQPSSTVQAGSDVSLQSTIGVVQGTNDAPPQISQRLTLVSPDGKDLSSTTKDATAIAGGGEYQTEFNFNLPKGVKDGQYMVRTEVLMNGNPVRTSETPMLVVG